MNVANKITVFRLILVPVYLVLLLVYREAVPGSVEWMRYAALAVFVVASVSDVIDGYIARTRGLATKLGGILDPLADKLLFGLGIIVLSLPPVEEGYPFEPPALWYPIAVVATNLTLGLGTLMAKILRKNLEIKSVPVGKAAAVFQTAAMCGIMLRVPRMDVVYYPAAILTVLSGIGYVNKAIRELRAATAGEQ